MCSVLWAVRLRKQDLLREDRQRSSGRALLDSLFDDDDIASMDIDITKRFDGFDLTTPRKLKYLPQIVRSLLKVIEDDSVLVNGSKQSAPVSELLERMGPVAAEDLEKAWNACRYGQRFECQKVPDLGDIRQFRLQQLLIMEKDDDGGATPALVVLRNLVQKPQTSKPILAVRLCL